MTSCRGNMYPFPVLSHSPGYFLAVTLWTLILLNYVPITFAGTQTFELSNLCKGKFPTQMQHREIDGAVIISRNEKNLDCSVTFTAEYVTQRFMIRFDEFQMECGDHLNIYDSSTAVGNARAELNCRYLRPEDIGVIRTRGHSVTLRFLTDNWGTSSRRFTMIITAYKDASQGCRDSFFCSADNMCISNRLLCDNVYNCGDRVDESRAANCSSNFLLDLIASAGAGDSTLGILIISGLVVISTVIVLVCVCLCQRRSAQNHIQNAQPSPQHHPINNHSKNEVRGCGVGGSNGAATTLVAMTDKTGIHRLHHQPPNQSTTLDSLVTKSGNFRLPAASHGYTTMKRLLHLLPCFMAN